MVMGLHLSKEAQQDLEKACHSLDAAKQLLTSGCFRDPGCSCGPRMCTTAYRCENKTAQQLSHRMVRARDFETIDPFTLRASP